MTKKRNARGTKLSKQRKTAHIGEDVMISETVAASNESIVDVDALVRIPDHVFVSVAKKRCFLGAFEIQSRKSFSSTWRRRFHRRSPTRGTNCLRKCDNNENHRRIRVLRLFRNRVSLLQRTLRSSRRRLEIQVRSRAPLPQLRLQRDANHPHSLLRCEKLRNKYIREQQTQTHAGQNQQQNFSRKEKTFLRALVLKALSLELQKIQVKRRGGIKRVGELVRATVSFKLRNAFREQ